MKVSSDFNIIDWITPKKNGTLVLRRIGNNYDGGYVVVPDIIKNTKKLISFGVGDDISFEVECKKINGDLDIELYDGTVASLPQDLECTFYNKNIYFDSFDPFAAAKVPFICKCDIEGEEYNITKLNPSSFENMKMMVLEVHDISKNFSEFIEMGRFLSGQKMNVVHIHGNNYRETLTVNNVIIPDTMELTIIKQDTEKDFVVTHRQYPIDGLDNRNWVARPDISFYL